LTAASCPKKDTPPHPLQTCSRLLYCILKIARLLYCVFKKASQKAGPKKEAKRRQKCSKKAAKKSFFLNLSCCCLETGLKPC